MSEAPTVPYESSEDARHLPAHLRRIASRDYCGVNEGFWIMRDAATEIERILSRAERAEKERDALREALRVARTNMSHLHVGDWDANGEARMTSDSRLTFGALRRANLLRLPQFKNRNGDPAHSEPDGSDWALSAWCNAVCGELGEAANLIKKIERGDYTLNEKREELAKEFADIVTYLDILALRAGVDLGEATILKFNEVSKRVGSTVRLAAMPGGGIVAGHAHRAVGGENETD